MRWEEWEYLDDQIAETADALSREMEADGFEDSWTLARVCWIGRRYDKVRELLSHTEPGEENREELFYMMAESCHELEDYENALKYRELIWEAHSEEERPARLYIDLAEDYDLSGDRQKALKLYRQAAERFGESGSCVTGRRKSWQTIRNFRKRFPCATRLWKTGFTRMPSTCVWRFSWTWKNMSRYG